MHIIRFCKENIVFKLYLGYKQKYIHSSYLNFSLQQAFFTELNLRQTLSVCYKDYKVMQEKLQAITQMQMIMSTQSLTPHELIIAAVHAINIYHKLKCINDNAEECQFPSNWKQTKNGAYVFNYINTNKGGNVNFKFTIVDDKAVVAFGYEGSKQINKVTFNKNDSSETIVKYYEFNLKQFLATQPTQSRPVFQSNNVKPNSNTFTPNNSFQNNQQTTFISNVQGTFPPRNMVNSSQATNPFGQDEYVGPNSQIFSNPYYNQTRVPSNMMIPPGARYDPVDPFDDPLRAQNNEINPSEDFIGFDQFGAPIKRKRTGFNPNAPNFGGFNGGFGGGFGGSRGGFGGGFGPVI